MKAELFEEDNKVNQAIKSYIECDAISSDDTQKQSIIHHRLGRLYESESAWEESILHLEKSSRLCQDNNDGSLGTVLFSLSSVYLKSKRYEDALRCNKQLVSHQSDSISLADVFHSMGQIYNKLSQYDDAIEYLNKSLSINRALGDPNQKDIAKILLDLATVHENLNDLTAASDSLVEVRKFVLSFIDLSPRFFTDMINVHRHYVLFD